MKILIIGGSGGLGSKVTELFVQQAIYAIFAPSSEELNICSFESCLSYMDKHTPDVVINFAGRNSDSFIHKIDLGSIRKVDQVISTATYGSIFAASSVLPYMRNKGYGRLIFVSSILTEKTVLGTGVYSSCKAFIDQLVKNISLENASKGVTANSIRLGYFEGGMTDRLSDKQGAINSVPLKRTGAIKELFDALNFIIDTEYFTGQNLTLSGGL